MSSTRRQPPEKSRPSTGERAGLCNRWSYSSMLRSSRAAPRQWSSAASQETRRGQLSEKQVKGTARRVGPVDGFAHAALQQGRRPGDPAAFDLRHRHRYEPAGAAGRGRLDGKGSALRTWAAVPCQVDRRSRFSSAGVQASRITVPSDSGFSRRDVHGPAPGRDCRPAHPPARSRRPEQARLACELSGCGCDRQPVRERRTKRLSASSPSRVRAVKRPRLVRTRVGTSTS